MKFCVNCGTDRGLETAIVKGFMVAQLIPLERFLCQSCLKAHATLYRPLFDCILSDKVVPKSRPKVARRGKISITYYPETYTNWRSAARAEIETAIPKNLLLPFDTAAPVAIFVDFYGSLRGNSDLDNAIGSILDVLAFESWCLSDDNVQRVPLINACFHPLPKSTKKNPQTIRTELKVYLYPQDDPQPPKTPRASKKPMALMS